jgi:hypothetical protein
MMTMMEGYELTTEGLLLPNGLVYVPCSDTIKLRILGGQHDSQVAGHLGQKNTFE